MMSPTGCPCPSRRKENEYEVCTKNATPAHSTDVGTRETRKAQDQCRPHPGDEELADWIARTQMGAIKDAMNLLRLPCDATDGVVELGKTEALEWLQQPAEGE